MQLVLCTTLGVFQVCRLLCLFSLDSLVLGVGMLPEEEMWICGPSQGQHVGSQYLEPQAFSKKGQIEFSVKHRASICAIP